MEPMVRFRYGKLALNSFIRVSTFLRPLVDTSLAIQFSYLVFLKFRKNVRDQIFDLSKRLYSYLGERIKQ